MLPTLDSLIDKFASKFRIEQELEEKENTVILHTHSYMGTRLLYSHTMDLTPLIEIAVARAVETAAHADASETPSYSEQ